MQHAFKCSLNVIQGLMVEYGANLQKEHYVRILGDTQAFAFFVKYKFQQLKPTK